MCIHLCRKNVQAPEETIVYYQTEIESQRNGMCAGGGGGS